MWVSTPATFATKSLATAPGSTTLTSMPNLATTGASDCISPSTANFAAQYASAKGWPTAPPTLVTVTMRPRPASRMGVSTNFVSPATPR